MFSAASLRINNDIVIFPDNNNNNFEKKDKSNTSSSSSSSSSSSTSCDAASTTFPFFSSLKEPLHERAFKVPIASRIAKFACKSFRQTVELSYVNRNFEDTMKRYHQCYKIIAMNLGPCWVDRLMCSENFSVSSSDDDDDDDSNDDDDDEDAAGSNDEEDDDDDDDDGSHDECIKKLKEQSRPLPWYDRISDSQEREKPIMKDLSVPCGRFVQSICCKIENLPPLDETMEEVDSIVDHLTDALIDKVLALWTNKIKWLQDELGLKPVELFQSEIEYDWNVRLRQDPQETLVQTLRFLPKHCCLVKCDSNQVKGVMLMPSIEKQVSPFIKGVDEVFWDETGAGGYPEIGVFELAECSKYPVSFLEHLLRVCSNHGDDVLEKVLFSKRKSQIIHNNGGLMPRFYEQEQNLLEVAKDKEKKNLLLRKIAIFNNIPRCLMAELVKVFIKNSSTDDVKLLRDILTSLSVNNVAFLIAVSIFLSPKAFTSAMSKIKLLDEKKFVEAMQDKTILFQALDHRIKNRNNIDTFKKLCKLLSEHNSLKKNLQYQPSSPGGKFRHSYDYEPSSIESEYTPLLLAARNPDRHSEMLRFLLLLYSDFGLLSHALSRKTKEGENIISVYKCGFYANRKPDSYKIFAVAIAAHFSSYKDFRSVVPKDDLPMNAFGNLAKKSIFGTLPPKRKKISGSRRNRNNDDDDDEGDGDSDDEFESIDYDLACHYYEWTHRFCCSGEYFRRK